MSIADKITRLQNAKTAIANAITGKGGTVSSGDGFEDFASDIGTIPEKEDATWNQCPTAVRNYLANVTYNPSDYTTSQIANYAPSTAVASNTKPIGKTIDGTTFYNEVPNVKTPFATTNKSGTIKPLDSLRWVNSTTTNFRDLGGWTCDGGTIKYGKLFRGAIPNVADKALVQTLGIKMELDIRGQAEAQQTESVWNIDYFCTENYIAYNTTGVPVWKEMLRTVFDSVAHNKPVFFHCTYGADRTGTLACVIEGMLGVSQSDIDKDYELTTFATGSGTDSNARRRNETEWRTLISAINAFSGSTFKEKCVNFVASCGFTANEINAFRAAMIDGTPATVTPSITYYSITNTLSNCTNGNAATSIQQNQFYDAVITPDSGYEMSSIAVTMGGTDITASAKTIISGSTTKGSGNHTVEIHTARVTGNIAVTASAIIGARIPSDYQEVEWIQTDGTATIQIELSSDYVGAYIEQQIMRVGSGVRGLIGSANTGSPTIGGGGGSYFGWNTSGYWEMGGSSVSTILSSTSQFDFCKFEWIALGSGKLTVNDVAATSRSGTGRYTKWNVFGGSSFPVACKQKECKVYNVAGGQTKTAHLVPCYRKADSVIGMYDIVGNTFYTNIASSGAFTKGSDV